MSEDGGQTLVAEPDESADETLTTDFYLSEGIDLSEANMEVASGSVTGNTPEAINPMECEYTAQKLANTTTTTEDGSKPYQIYRISLTEEQAAAGAYHIGWYGTCLLYTSALLRRKTTAYFLLGIRREFRMHPKTVS